MTKTAHIEPDCQKRFCHQILVQKRVISRLIMQEHLNLITFNNQEIVPTTRSRWYLVD